MGNGEWGMGKKGKREKGKGKKSFFLLLPFYFLLFLCLLVSPFP
jgi:hypothetical protein